MDAIVLLAIVAACFCTPVLGDSSSSSSTGVLGDVSSSSTGSLHNVTLLQSSASLVPGLPVSNLVAIVLACVGVLGMCLCLLCCARQQIRVQAGAPTAAKGSALSARMQAKLDAARRGWKKTDIDANGVGGTVVAVASAGAGAGAGAGATPGGVAAASSGTTAGSGARGPPVSAAAQAAARSSALSCALSGGSMGGLGALRYPDFTAEELLNEAWASPEVVRCLKASGHMLDVVLAARSAAVLSLWSGLVPLALAVALPFHRRILARLEITDWYGRVEQLQLWTCLAVALSGLALHALAFMLARRILTYDNDRASSPGAADRAGGGLAKMPSLPSAATLQAGLGPSSPTAGGSFGAAGSNNNNSSNDGEDPALWPLTLLCVCGLLSYALLGWQGFVSFDESLGRQYGVTSTPRRLWPPSAGQGPVVTFALCVVVGAAAMLPLAFSIRIIALFKPRAVHPNLIKNERE